MEGEETSSRAKARVDHLLRLDSSAVSVVRLVYVYVVVQILSLSARSSDPNRIEAGHDPLRIHDIFTSTEPEQSLV